MIAYSIAFYWIGLSICLLVGSLREESLQELLGTALFWPVIVLVYIGIGAWRVCRKINLETRSPDGRGTE